jgi:hypothetical protein
VKRTNTNNNMFANLSSSSSIFHLSLFLLADTGKQDAAG